MGEKGAFLTKKFDSGQVMERLHDELLPRSLRYHIESFGCQMSVNDGEKFAGMLCDMGMIAADTKEEADIILYNTCCVREHAEKRIFGNVGALEKIKREKPGLMIGVAGCMMQQQEVAKRLYKRFPFVDFVMGTHSIQEFPQVMERVLEGERVFSFHDTDGEIIEGIPMLRATGVSASVAIMFGCNNFCSYCIVPYVRGRERSRKTEDILQEVRQLADQGYSEIVLLGQNVNSYGNNGGEISFPQLLQMVNEVEGIRRIRFMTSHPKDLSDELIDTMARADKVCNHIHLPVQSGSNRILKAMNRSYTREDYLGLVEKLRTRVPEIELTTDVIVGFPGETEEDFHDTLDLMQTVGFAAAFTFMYSPRTGTVAATMQDQISEQVKKQRLLQLNEIQAEQTRKNNVRHIGKTGEVLVEGYDQREQGIAYGKLGNFKMVYFPGTPDMIGQYVDVAVEGTNKNSLIGRLI